MFAIERVRIIKNYLLKDQKVSVAKLSTLLDVTEVTIRRDLEKLEKEGFLKRTHGGAVLLNYSGESLYDESIEDEQIELYQEIADTAYHLVSDYDSILLTNGPINAFIARSLAKRNNLTVVTNDIKIAQEFSGSQSNNLILLGGDLDEHALFGQMAIDNLKNFAFQHVFLEIDALNNTVGMMVSSVKKATFIQQALKLADSVTVVCLSTSFGGKSLYRIGPLTLAHRILTDSKLDDEYKNYIFNSNIPIFTSIDIYEE
ncbi:MAG: DeoR/GlpR transcriptional regulator [Vallitaleaceae bacterium]|nr:DeoR/GlpR transcriptional regulator [Vallitaleaceae bacterium]